MVVKVPENYRKSADLVTTVSFLDTVTGIGYIKLFPCGSTSSAGNTYFLTTDETLQADEENFSKSGTGADLDFDITIGRPFIIAATDAIIVSAQNTDTGENQTVTWKIHHVDSAATETQLGITVGGTISGSAGAEHFTKTTKVTLTRKRFTKGDKLRLNLTTSSGTFSSVYFDPSGVQTQTAETPNTPLKITLLIPIEVEL